MTDERYEVFEDTVDGTMTTLTNVAGENWDSYNEVFFSTGGFISHRENESTGQGYVMDIQGTVDPFVPGSWKLWGATEVYTCDTDAQNGLDTYTRELTYDTLFPWHRNGYEFWQLETTEGIEWTRTVYWVGTGGDPPYLGAHSLTTTGIEYYSADGPGAPSTEEPPIEEPSSEDAVLLDDVSEEDFDLDHSDFQGAV